METLDPIVRDLGIGALNPQEYDACSYRPHHHYKQNMGLLLILIIALFFASSNLLIWPVSISAMLIPLVSSPRLFKERMQEKR